MRILPFSTFSAIRYCLISLPAAAPFPELHHLVLCPILDTAVTEQMGNKHTADQEHWQRMQAAHPEVDTSEKPPQHLFVGA